MAVYALFNPIWYVGGFGDLCDSVLPNLRGVNGDVVTIYAYHDTKGSILQSVPLPSAAGNPCQRRGRNVSTIKGLVNGPLRSPCYLLSRGGGGPMLRGGGRNQTWLTSGPSGYIMPAVWEGPQVAERGAKSIVAYKWPQSSETQFLVFLEALKRSKKKNSFFTRF